MAYRIHLSLFLQIILAQLLVVQFVGAQTSAATSAQAPHQVQILREGAEVFKEPNFDSEVIAQLAEGRKFFSSSKKFNGTFYRILVGKGLTGYIADSDARPLHKQGVSGEDSPGKSKSGKNDEAAGKMQKKTAPKPERRKVFSNSNFVGVSYSMIDYKENTMGDHRRDQLGFFGFKVSGPDLLVEGPMPTELNILFYPGAPSYYEKTTGRAASGWVLIMDGIWQNYYPLSREAFGIYGFGPLFKFSKYNLGLVDKATGATSYYSAEDMSLGLVFSVGAALRLGSVALRGEYSYYWEKEAYGAFSLSLQKDF